MMRSKGAAKLRVGVDFRCNHKSAAARRSMPDFRQEIDRTLRPGARIAEYAVDLLTAHQLQRRRRLAEHADFPAAIGCFQNLERGIPFRSRITDQKNCSLRGHFIQTRTGQRTLSDSLAFP